MNDRANINVNVNVTGKQDVKALGPDLKQVANEAANTGKVVGELSAAITKLQASGMSWIEAQRTIIAGSKDYTKALREEAAGILTALGDKDKYTNALARGIDLHEKSAAAIRKEAAEAETSQKRQLSWMYQMEAAKKRRVSAGFAAAEAEDKAEEAAAKAALKRRDTVAKEQARWESDRRKDQERTAKEYTKFWSEALKTREKEERQVGEQIAKNRAAERRASSASVSEDTRTENRRARSFLLPFLGQGGVNLPIPARVGLSAASAAIGQPGGGYGQVGLLSEATSVVGKFGTIGIVGAATVLTLGAVSKELFDLTKNVAAGALELQNFANRLGISTVEAEKLQIASQIVGVNFSSLEAGARKISVALEDSTGLGKTAAAALQGVGISIKELNGDSREVGPVLLEFLQKLAGLSSETERISTANRVLGRESRELIPLIRNYDELQKTVSRLSRSLDEDVNKNLAKAGQEFNTFSAAWDLLKKSLAERIAPIIVPIIRNITEVITPGGDGGSKLESFSREDFFSEGKVPAAGRKKLDMNYFLAQEKNKGLDADKDAFKKGMLQNDEEAISAEIQEIKKRRREITEKLSNRIDKDVRGTLTQDNNKLTAEQQALESRLKSLRKADNTAGTIERELAQLEERAVAIEARAAGIDDKVATKQFKIDQLKRGNKGKITGAQLAKASGFIDREIAAQATMDERAVAKEQQLEDRRTSFAAQRNDLALRSQVISEKIRLNEIGAADAIQSKYQSAKDELAIMQAEEKAGIELTMVGQQKTIALIKLKGQVERAEAAASKERQMDIAQLESDRRQRDINYQKQTNGMLRQFAVSETTKEFGKAERLANATAGFGQGAFGAVRAQQQRLELAKVLYGVEMQMAEEGATEDEKKLARLQAYINLLTKDREAQRDHEASIQEFQQKGIDRVRENTGKAFDAISSQGLSGGIGGLLRTQVTGIARTLAQNTGQEVYTSGKSIGLPELFGGAAKQVTTGSDGTPKLTGLGRMLAGTPFGVDVEKIALDRNTTSQERNTAALNNNTRAQLAGASGGVPGFVGITPDMVGGLPGLSAAGILGPGSLTDRASGIADLIQTPGVVRPQSALSGALGGFATGVGSLINGNPYKTMMGGKATIYDEMGTPSTINTSSGTQRAGAAVAVAGALVSGAQGIYSGIKQGGARGFASATESALYTASALSPEPISKAVLAASALAIGVFKGLLGDPRKNREEDIDRFLRENKVDVPENDEVMQDIAGRDVSYDKMGKTRFGKSTIINVNVSALDTQSFLDRSADIGAALTKELAVGNQPLANQVQKVVFG